MKKSDFVRFQHLLEAIEHIELFVGQDPELQELRTAQAIHYELVVIGEAARHIPETFQQRFTDLPWRKMIALRNHLSHEYYNVKREMILAAVGDLPRVKQRILLIIDEIKHDQP